MSCVSDKKCGHEEKKRTSRCVALSEKHSDFAQTSPTKFFKTKRAGTAKRFSISTHSKFFRRRLEPTSGPSISNLVRNGPKNYDRSFDKSPVKAQVCLPEFRWKSSTPNHRKGKQLRVDKDTFPLELSAIQGCSNVHLANSPSHGSKTVLDSCLSSPTVKDLIDNVDTNKNALCFDDKVNPIGDRSLQRERKEDSVNECRLTPTGTKLAKLQRDSSKMSKYRRFVMLKKTLENRPSNQLKVVIANEDDDIILVDENGKEVEDNGKKENKNTAIDVDEEPSQLCVLHRHVITEHDYETLEEGMYLNDAILDFYITFMYEALPDSLKDVIHIFSSHFYSRLKGSGRKKTLGSMEEWQCQAEKCYLRVKSWTKKVDIFSKKMLIFPICEEDHWYLLLVCNPGLVTSDVDQRTEGRKKTLSSLEHNDVNPFIIVLDSLGGTHSTAINNIRSYLQFEFLERKKVLVSFGKDKIEEKHPNIPYQPNSCDCGVFLLHYVELIFKDPSKFVGVKWPDNLSDWFDTKDVICKREEIAKLIQKLAKQQAAQKGLTILDFPRIKFPTQKTKKNYGKYHHHHHLGEQDNSSSMLLGDPDKHVHLSDDDTYSASSSPAQTRKRYFRQKTSCSSPTDSENEESGNHCCPLRQLSPSRISFRTDKVGSCARRDRLFNISCKADYQEGTSSSVLKKNYPLPKIILDKNHDTSENRNFFGDCDQDEMLLRRSRKLSNGCRSFVVVAGRGKISYEDESLTLSPVRKRRGFPFKPPCGPNEPGIGKSKFHMKTTTTTTNHVAKTKGKSFKSKSEGLGSALSD